MTNPLTITDSFSVDLQILIHQLLNSCVGKPRTIETIVDTKIKLCNILEQRGYLVDHQQFSISVYQQTTELSTYDSTYEKSALDSVGYTKANPNYI